MKNKKLLFTVIYWIVGLALFTSAYLLVYYSSLHVMLSSYTDGTLFRTSVEVSLNIPGSIALLGGNLITSCKLNISNAIGISFTKIENNVEIQGFKIDYITCGILLGSLLIFLIDAIFKKHKIINYVAGSLICLSGIALYFEPIYFAYFNKDSFSDLNKYLETINNLKIEYSNICIYIASSIVLLVGLLIIIYEIIKSIKEKKER